MQGDKLSAGWCGAYRNSRSAKSIFKTIAEESVQKNSVTRWWARWQVNKQLVNLGRSKFKQIVGRLRKLELCTRSIAKIDSLTTNELDLAFVELAAQVDYGTPIVRATYLLEGDSALWSVTSRIVTEATELREPKFDSLSKVSADIIKRTAPELEQAKARLQREIISQAEAQTDLARLDTQVLGTRSLVRKDGGIEDGLISAAPGHGKAPARLQLPELRRTARISLPADKTRVPNIHYSAPRAYSRIDHKGEKERRQRLRAQQKALKITRSVLKEATAVRVAAEKDVEMLSHNFDRHREEARRVARPVMKYLRGKFTDPDASFRNLLNGYTAAKLLHPMEAQKMSESTMRACIMGLKAFTWMTDSLVTELMSELPMYRREIMGTKLPLPTPYSTSTSDCPRDSRGSRAEKLSIRNEAVSVVRWWNSPMKGLVSTTIMNPSGSKHYRRCIRIPYFGKVVAKLNLVNPSSGAAERIFSMLQDLFGDKQYSILNDVAESSVMLKANKES